MLLLVLLLWLRLTGVAIATIVIDGFQCMRVGHMFRVTVCNLHRSWLQMLARAEPRTGQDETGDQSEHRGRATLAAECLAGESQRWKLRHRLVVADGDGCRTKFALLGNLLGPKAPITLRGCLG
jgi:aminoglycoside phosphotransferase